MASLLLDIRYRIVDAAVVGDAHEMRFQKSYDMGSLEQGESEDEDHRGAKRRAVWQEGELADLISLIKQDADAAFDQVHIVIPDNDIRVSHQRLPRMPYPEALKTVTRKIAEESKEELPQVAIIPMMNDQKHQTWLVEYIPTSTLKAYKREFAGLRLKLRTVTTGINTVMYALAPLREAIFNAHAIFEFKNRHVNAYYVSSSNLLLHESLPIPQGDEREGHQDQERATKRRIFSILDLVYQINSQYLSANTQTPLQKAWVCCAEEMAGDLVAAVQDAMDVDTALLCSDSGETPVSGSSIALSGLLKGLQNGTVANFMHPELQRRFPLRKKSGLIIYATTLLIAFGVVAMTEMRHKQLLRKLVLQKQALDAQKNTSTVSSATAKSIDLLKQLTGDQISFYPILREFAMNLPDGIYIESFNFSQKEKNHSIELLATLRYSDDLGTQKPLTRLLEMINSSDYLVRTSEPTITVTSQDKQKVVAVKLTCEAKTRDQKK